MVTPLQNRVALYVMYQKINCLVISLKELFSGDKIPLTTLFSCLLFFTLQDSHLLRSFLYAQIELSSLLAFYIILLYNSIYLRQYCKHQFIVCLPPWRRVPFAPHLLQLWLLTDIAVRPNRTHVKWSLLGVWS